MRARRRRRRRERELNGSAKCARCTTLGADTRTASGVEAEIRRSHVAIRARGASELITFCLSRRLDWQSPLSHSERGIPVAVATQVHSNDIRCHQTAERTQLHSETKTLRRRSGTIRSAPSFPGRPAADAPNIKSNNNICEQICTICAMCAPLNAPAISQLLHFCAADARPSAALECPGWRSPLCNTFAQYFIQCDRSASFAELQHGHELSRPGRPNAAERARRVTCGTILWSARDLFISPPDFHLLLGLIRLYGDPSASAASIKVFRPLPLAAAEQNE